MTRVIARAGEGDQPLIIEVQVTEGPRDDELATVLEAAGHAPRRDPTDHQMSTLA